MRHEGKLFVMSDTLRYVLGSAHMLWIIQNKEWLFSGIAIAIPVAIIGWFSSGRGDKQVQKSGNNSTNVQVGGNLRIGGDSDDK